MIETFNQSNIHTYSNILKSKYRSTYEAVETWAFTQLGTSEGLFSLTVSLHLFRSNFQGNMLSVNLMEASCIDNNVAVKLDVAKAFDTLNWGFLLRLLIAFGFNATFVQWALYSP